MRTLAIAPQPAAARTGPVVRYGTLAVPRRAQAAVDEAFAYLSHDTVERSLIERLEASPTPHRIVLNHRNDDSYDPSTHEIRWDPTSALATSSGGRQSPALGLGHEIDHAVEGADAYDDLVGSIDLAFDNAEERRVILGSERHAALTLGESVRWDHDGATYRVPDPVAR